MSRSWKLSLVFVSSLALGTFANAQLAVGAGARGQALGSLNGNGFVTTGSLNADGTVHGGFNDGVRFAQPSPNTTETTTARASKKAPHTAANASTDHSASASVNSGSHSVNAGTTTTANASVHGAADTHR